MEHDQGQPGRRRRPPTARQPTLQPPLALQLGDRLQLRFEERLNHGMISNKSIPRCHTSSFVERRFKFCRFVGSALIIIQSSSIHHPSSIIHHVGCGLKSALRRRVNQPASKVSTTNTTSAATSNQRQSFCRCSSSTA